MCILAGFYLAVSAALAVSPLFDFHGAADAAARVVFGAGGIWVFGGSLREWVRDPR